MTVLLMMTLADEVEVNGSRGSGNGKQLEDGSEVSRDAAMAGVMQTLLVAIFEFFTMGE